ncbi:GNAT family N-acetyltransferase [Dactylosporangium roseum]|uniref:GNAT family N-acetyltransferase n=1 Tax=Dactylosporangium roseum TaxID=47989 RepID=A0ABY5YUZ2_9ACTN|nr:GNAT family N-acetyltransferase [Dactylosporangium roseum]UWZ33545.1 GNAT family N-acetyltransferase [Dactylosporangium roseum]
MTATATVPAAPARVRPATPADEPFLRTVHAAARAEEAAAFGWSPAQVDAFLTIQFDAQRRHYRTVWPHATDGIVEAGGVPVGRLYVDRGSGAFTVLDIALLPDRRGAGLGGALLRGLQAEAAALDVPVELRVLRTGRALRLYRRLGFRADGGDEHRLALRWDPPGHARWQAAAGTAGTLGGLPALLAACTGVSYAGGYEHFGVTLRVPGDATVEQGTYRFVHPALGALDLFVVPTARTAEGLALTATFTRAARPAAEPAP